MKPEESAAAVATTGLGDQWRVTAPAAPTCKMGGSSSTIDFFICHASLAPVLGQLQVEQGWTWAPHLPASLQLRVSRHDLDS